jgi:hypothetical protein
MECLLKILVYTLRHYTDGIMIEKDQNCWLIQLVKVELLLDSCLNQFLSTDQKGRKINDNGCGDCIF